jgi:hypothetical protein
MLNLSNTLNYLGESFVDYHINRSEEIKELIAFTKRERIGYCV